MIDLSPFLHAVERSVARHALGPPGSHARYTRPGVDERGAARELGENAYGCADAANLLYTLGALPASPAVRSGWVERLRALQDAETGLYEEASHDAIHTTAHCLSTPYSSMNIDHVNRIICTNNKISPYPSTPPQSAFLGALGDCRPGRGGNVPDPFFA